MTPRPRVVNIIVIRVDYHCQYLLFASLTYGRVKLSVMCVLLCLQLWATTTSFLLQGALKLHAHLLILFLRLYGLAQVYLDDSTQGHLIESYLAKFLPCVDTYLSTSILIALPAEAVQRMLSVSDTYTHLSTTVNVISIISLFSEEQVLRACFL